MTAIQKTPRCTDMVHLSHSETPVSARRSRPTGLWNTALGLTKLLAVNLALRQIMPTQAQGPAPGPAPARAPWASLGADAFVPPLRDDALKPLGDALATPSLDSRCGVNEGEQTHFQCLPSLCCSDSGWCGTGPAYCAGTQLNAAYNGPVLLPSTPEPPDVGPYGWVDPLNGLNVSRWTRLNDTANGEAFNCGFSARAVRFADSLMTMKIEPGNFSGRPYSCGQLNSRELYLFGNFSVRMRAAKHPGVITSIFTYRGAQEIDVELTGRDTTVLWATSYNNGTRNPESVMPIALGFDAAQGFHTYTLEWRPDHITWSADGRVLRTITAGLPQPVPQAFIVNTWLHAKGDPHWSGDYQDPVPAVSSTYNWLAYAP